MRINRFIYQHKVIEKILEYLQVYEEEKQRAPPLKKTLFFAKDSVDYVQGNRNNWKNYLGYNALSF